MLRKLIVLVVVVPSAVLASAGGTLATTDNSFCEINDPTLLECGTVVLEKIVSNPCPPNAEFVALSGTIHVSVFQDENQNRIHTNWQDVRGVGLTTGAIYQANEATRFYLVERPAGSFSTVLQDERTLLSKGSLQNFILRERLEITSDPPNIEERSETKCTG